MGVRFDALKERAVFQATGDVEETPELEPYVGQYINEGYDRLHGMYAGRTPEPLLLAPDEPDLPEWAHGAIADYAAFMLLRNGNPQRQGRGMQFRAAFEEAVARVLREGGSRGKRTRLTGFYP